ncbi:uncharacterized protein LOC127619452 [Xyrauchen texanus]|uniref:uncharacterized protein LOC127619452 n=1 Tax=Xyrauchen texanus TaxID=154827 RepID=UPI002242AC25|nr:uncharacterized protein LOC127619452 [Xyrauchen texanus]
MMGNLQYLSVLIVAAICCCEGKETFSTSKALHAMFLNHEWMNKIEDTRLLSAVSIPGTHQSNRHSKSSPPTFQAWGLHNQLDAGVRFFDLHVSSGTIKHDTTGSIKEKRTLVYALDTFLTFLAKQRKETLLLRVTPDEGAVAEVTELLSKDKPVWRDSEIPTMGQARGKIVLIQSSTLKLGLSVQVTELDADMDKKESQMRENIKLASQNCEREMMLTYTGAKGESEDPLDIAEKLNQPVDKYLLDLKGDTSRPRCVGIIVMDFPGPKVIETIINFNGKLGDTSNIAADMGSNEDVALPDSTDQISDSDGKEKEKEVSSDGKHSAQDNEHLPKEESHSSDEKQSAEDSGPPPPTHHSLQARNMAQMAVELPHPQTHHSLQARNMAQMAVELPHPQTHHSLQARNMAQMAVELPHPQTHHSLQARNMAQMAVEVPHPQTHHSLQARNMAQMAVEVPHPQTHHSLQARNMAQMAVEVPHPQTHHSLQARNMAQMAEELFHPQTHHSLQMRNLL